MPEQEPVNFIASVSLHTGDVQPLVGGSDFFAYPRISPCGQRVLWMEWLHPHMPWDESEFWVGELDAAGDLTDCQLVVGEVNEAVFQPTWRNNEEIIYVSDRSGFSNLYIQNVVTLEAPLSVRACQNDFGEPLWELGAATYCPLSDGRILCSYAQNGSWRLAVLTPSTEGGFELENIPSPYSAFGGFAAKEGVVALTVAGPLEPPALVELDLQSLSFATVKQSFSLPVDERYISRPQSTFFPTEGGLVSHGFYYPPVNDDYLAPAGELPPLIIIVHGGPTAATSNCLRLAVQFWTSRGFAVFDVNYGGSSGYGRAYQDRLKGNWGLVDVQDCVNAAKTLADWGRVDENRMGMRGGSAGGYTTLAALCFSDVFKVGGVYYGVGDIEDLAKTTHKFEGHYMIGLVGEDRQVWRDRSPAYHLDSITVPVILFQGLDDEIVPPQQSINMAKALSARGLPVSLTLYEKEDHGFRGAEAIRHSLLSELAFYGRVFGFVPADEVPALSINNMA